MSFLKKFKTSKPATRENDCITQNGSNHQYIPIETNHGPGLYRNHTMVHGDSLRTREYNRTYIQHRPAFDWYRNDRYNLIDDIEEILLPGHLQNPKFDLKNYYKPDPKYKRYRRDYGDEEYTYNVNETYASRTRHRGNRCSSHVPVVRKEPEPEPVYRPEPQPEPVYYSEPKPVVVSKPEPVQQPTYSNITSIKTVHMPKYTGPDIVYHGKTGNPKEYNQDFSLYRSKSLNNNAQYTNYKTHIDRSSYVNSVKDVDQDYARRLLMDLQRLERESRHEREKTVHFNNAGFNKQQEYRYD